MLSHTAKKRLKDMIVLNIQHICNICPAYKCENANNCWHFSIYEHNKFHMLHKFLMLKN